MLIQKYVRVFYALNLIEKHIVKMVTEVRKKIQAVYKCGRKGNNKRRMKLDGEK